MILHFITDDKFADYVINQFEAPEMQSEFVLIPINGEPSLVQQMDKVRIVRYPSADFDDLLLHLGNYMGIVLHGLFWRFDEDILRVVSNNVKVAWVFWGGEIYGREDLYERFLSHITKMLCRIHKRVKRKNHERDISKEYEMPLECFRRIDYCLCDVTEEEAFLKEYVDKDFYIRWYNYYSVEETIGVDLITQICQGHNVLVGNSSSIECNHIEILLSLKRVGFKRGDLIVPLSYGEPWLRNTVCKIGRFLFGDQFRALTDYMPREEYNQIIASCSVVIMNHWRQQAFGNIMTALWLGSRVYMSKRSPLYAYFKRLGCILYSVEDDLTRNRIKWNPLSDAEREQNRKAICAEYNKETMHMRNLELVRELNA